MDNLENKQLNTPVEEADTPAQVAESKAPKTTEEKPHWYIIHTYTTYEHRVLDGIKEMVAADKLENQIFDVRIIEEEEVYERNGKRKTVIKRKYPSYVFIKMIYSDFIYFKVTKLIRGVTGFVGPGGKPEPLSDDEIKRMGLEKITAEDFDILVGDSVRISQGSFEGYYGEVTKIDFDTNTLEVSVSLFGKPTPIKLELNQVVKA